MDPLYEIKENPDYDPVIRALKNEDQASADQVFNPLLQKMINNTHAVKQQVDSVEEKVEELQESTSTNLNIYDEDNGSTQSKRIVKVPQVQSYGDLKDRVLTIRPIVSSSTTTYQAITLNINQLGEKNLCPPGLDNNGELYLSSANYAYAIKVNVPYMVTYVSSQDVFLLINPQWTNANTSRRGVVQLNNTVTSTSASVAATANALKLTYDHASDAHAKADNILEEKLPTKADLVNGKVSAEQLPNLDYDVKGSADAVKAELTTHTNKKDNPHGVTAAQVQAIPSSQKGTAGGVAELGSDGKVPSGQLPSLDYDPKGSADAVKAELTTHTNKKDNPHGVTAAQVQAIPASQKGAAGGVAELGSDGRVPNGQLPSLDYDPKGSAATVQTALNNHTANQSNPHKVSASDVGLGNVNNTSDANKPISTAVQTALNAKSPTSHASATESYGTGSGSNYGHVKLSDSYSSTSGAGSGIAATPGAVKSAYDLAASKVTVKSVNVSLTISGWSGSGPYTQSVTASGVTSSNHIAVGIGSSATELQIDAAAIANLLATSQSTNSVTIRAYGSKPTVAIPVTILIWG